MEASGLTGLYDSPVHVYSRAAIDEFLAEAASERSRLESVIADDEERTRRARAAMGTHRVMVAMLLTAQRELDEVRARAEREAAAILADAQRPVHVLDLTRPEPPAPSTTSPPVADVWPATVTETRMPTPVASNPVPAVHEGESNEYFDFLRGALDDHEPLGPRPESA